MYAKSLLLLTPPIRSDLGANSLSGTIPDSLGSLPSLQRLYVLIRPNIIKVYRSLLTNLCLQLFEEKLAHWNHSCDLYYLEIYGHAVCALKTILSFHAASNLLSPLSAIFPPINCLELSHLRLLVLHLSSCTFEFIICPVLMTALLLSIW